MPCPPLCPAGLTSGGRRLSVRVSHALHGGGSHAHGHGDPLAQDRGGQVHHRHVPEHPGVQLPPGTHTEKPNFKRLQHGGEFTALNGQEQVFLLSHGGSCAGAGTESHCVIQSCRKTPGGSRQGGTKEQEGERGKDPVNIIGWRCWKGKAGAVEQCGSW